MALSVEMNVPIIAVVQANREAAGEDNEGTPNLETIRSSDGIAHNASKVIAIRQKNDTLEMSIKKSRTGTVGNTLLYNWDINYGKFTYIPSRKSGLPQDIDEFNAQANKDKYTDVGEVF